MLRNLNLNNTVSCTQNLWLWNYTDDSALESKLTMEVQNRHIVHHTAISLLRLIPLTLI